MTTLSDGAGCGCGEQTNPICKWEHMQEFTGKSQGTVGRYFTLTTMNGLVCNNKTPPELYQHVSFTPLRNVNGDNMDTQPK